VPARAGQAIICAALALEAEIAARQFETEAWGPETSDLTEFVGRAAREGCRGIVSFGVAGGLYPDLRSGDIVVASEVVGPNGSIPTDDAWSAWLLSSIPTSVYGRIAGVDLPVSANTSRTELRLRSGALAADMESHVIARVAETNALRFVALRVVIDSAERNLPPTALGCVSSDGEISRWRLSRLLLGRPSDSLDLIKLSADWWLARRALLYCSDVLSASVSAIEL
jgi:hypothetical protein